MILPDKGLRLMQIKNLTKHEIRECFDFIEKYVNTFEQKWVKYIDLGCKTIKLVSYSDEFLPLVEKQLTYVLKDKADSYDATLIIWEEKNLFPLLKKMNPKFDSKNNIRLRLEAIYSREKAYNIEIIDNDISKTKPVIDMQATRNFITANDYEKNTFYYGAGNLEPEEFIKEGHIFVQFFNNILKTPSSNLIHGAVIGLDNNGICFCARGQRGKSTLSVLSMFKGFEYVSDDYLILHNDKNGKLLSSPIYSIITLAPVMYNRLYDYLKGSQFVSNNARKDKYVFNISNYHKLFRKNYPIELCIFPEIVSDNEPSIKPCSSEEKGRAIVQIIQSTLMQTNDLSDNASIGKIMNMVKDLPFFKLNLCWDIDRNTEYLRSFMNNFPDMKNEIVELPKIAVDITFDLANILDTETNIIYSMNKLATNIYENLINGVSPDSLKQELSKYLQFNPNIENEFDLFIENLKSEDIYSDFGTSSSVSLNLEFAKENNFRLSFIKHSSEKHIELVKEKKYDKLQVK